MQPVHYIIPPNSYASVVCATGASYIFDQHALLHFEVPLYCSVLSPASMDPDACGDLDLDLDLNLSLQSSLAPEPEPPGYFICSYCGKKFCSPQAFGGHQNAHKLERSVTKRALELAAARRHDGHGGESSIAANEHSRRGKGPVGIAELNTAARLFSSHQIKASPEASRDSITEDMDLSLKL